jgi:hypothetical protein
MMPAAALERPTPEEQRDFIREHEVCWETIVHRDVGPRGIAPIGYDVVLRARCRQRGCDPAGTRALELYEALTTLARAVIPAEHRDDIHVAAFEPAFHLRRQVDWQPEVQVVIEIRHDHDYFDAVDDDERSCVRQLEGALRSWGVQHEIWLRPQKSAPR